MMNEILKLEEKIVDAIVGSNVKVLDQLLHNFDLTELFGSIRCYEGKGLIRV